MALSLAEFKELLGSFGETLTDEQIRWLYDAEYKLADAMFEWWLRKRNAPKQIADKPEKEDTTDNTTDDSNQRQI